MSQSSENRGRVDRLLKQIDERMGSGILKLDENGVCLLETEAKQRIRIEVRGEDPYCYLAAPLTFAPTHPEPRKRLLKQALSDNFFGAETRNATLSLEPGTEIVYLHYACELDELDDIKLENIFHNFAATTAVVKKRLEQSMLGQQADAPAPATTDKPTTEPGGFMMGSFV